MKRLSIRLLLCSVALASAFGCAGAPGSTESDDDAPGAASTIVGPDDELGLRPSTILGPQDCWAQIERPSPADLVLKIGTPITLRTGGPICPEGVTEKLAYRFYVEKVDRNGNIISPRVSPQGATEWSLTKSPFDTANLTPGRYRVYMFSLPRTMIDAWKAFDAVARNRSTRSGNAYVTFINTSWVTGGYGVCSEACGPGTQTRPVTCTDDFAGAHPDSWCTQTKPDASAACEGTACATYAWTTGAWSSCDTTCGVGTSARQVSCIELPASIPALDSMCDAGQKPAATESCEDNSQCAVPDTTGPVLASASPAAGEAGVAASVVLSATYDEPLAAQSSVSLKRGATIVPGTTSITGNTITFTPTSALRTTVTTYSVVITALDAEANQTTTSYTFTTRDAAPPTLSNVYPASGETGVPRGVNVVMSSNEPLVAQSSSVVLTKVSDGSTIAGATTVDGTTIMFDPGTLLQAFTAYSALVTATDAAGNQATAVVAFTTGNATF